MRRNRLGTYDIEEFMTVAGNGVGEFDPRTTSRNNAVFGTGEEASHHAEGWICLDYHIVAGS